MLRAEIAKRKEALKKLYLDRAANIIEESQFLELNQSFLAEKNRFEQRLIYLEAEAQQGKGDSTKDKSLAAKLQELLQFKELEVELVGLLIESIQVGVKDKVKNQQEIIINWRL